MKAFTIDADQNICFYETKKEAIRHAESEGCAIFTSQDELDAATKNMPVATLADIFNSFTGVTEVKTFPSRKAGLSRIWAECRKMTQKGLHAVIAEPAETPDAAAETAHAQPATQTAVDTPFDEQETATVGDTPTQEAPATNPAKVRTPRAAKAPKPAKVAKAPKESAKSPRKPRGEGKSKVTKNEMIRNMILKPGGTTEAAVIKATGWKRVSGTVGVISKTIPGFEYYKLEKGGRGFRVRTDHAEQLHAAQ